MADNNQELKLPSIPKDCYYEDYVAAILNAGGYYLDRSVHRIKGGLSLFELDAVATKFEADKSSKMIIEVKSGGWGIRDLFKVKGWIHYLGENNAAFIYQERPDVNDEEKMHNLATELSIALIPNLKDDAGKFDNSNILKNFDINLDHVHKSVILTFRYAYDMERVMLDYISHFSKNNPQFKTPTKVYQYFRRLVDESFFLSDPVKRLDFLTNLSLAHKNIACILDNELKGKGVLLPEECVLFERLYEIENPVEMKVRAVDVALYVQLLNRLYVLKSMVEYLLQQPREGRSCSEEMIERLNYMQLNTNISYGIDNLRGHTHFHLYPYFFQVFFFVYGGFFMKAKEQEEQEKLSLLTGLPQKEISLALSFWDDLFPLSGGGSWMKTMNHDGLYYMEFVPVPLRGLGVNYRRHYYAPDGMSDSDEMFENLKNLVSTHCYNDMIHWNNSAYITLSQDSNLHPRQVITANKFEKHLNAAKEYILGKGCYETVSLLSEIAEQKKCSNIKVEGFLCELPDEQYDLYVVKSNNNLLNFPINQVVKDLKLNQGNFRQCFVIGTDEYKQKEEEDTIWYTFAAHHASLSSLDSVIDEVDKIRQ